LPFSIGFLGSPAAANVRVDRHVAATAASPAGEFRGDPADRFIVATAIVNFAKRAASFQVQAC
jgi:PIN domain nuclease of toxin-antitoxin system